MRIGKNAASARLASSIPQSAIRNPQSIAVVGVGNLIMGDDGVGIAVIRELGNQPLPERVALFDAGTALLDVLPEIEDCGRIVLVDCCRAGGAPGSVYRTQMRLEEWQAEPLGESLHDLNVLHALQLHRIVTGKMNEVVLIGVEPESVALREGLSPALRARAPEIVAAVRAELGPPAYGGTE